MPFSDNLYSLDDDSDGDSFSEELSPTDGFMHQTEIPTNTLVQDPTIGRDTKAEAKVLIPTPVSQSSTGRASRLSNHSGPSQSIPPHPYASVRSSDRSSTSPISYTPVSPTSPRRREELFTEHTPLMNGPPPAYSASPEPSTSKTSENERRYSTFPEHHLERGFLPRSEPESMGRPIEISDETTPLSEERPRRQKRHHLRQKFIKKFLFIALVVAVIFAIFHPLFNRKKGSPVKKEPDDKDGMPPSDDGRPIDLDGPYCPAARYKKEEVTYEFPIGTDLSVLQTTYGDQTGSHSVNVDTVGEIRLRRIPKDSKHGNQAYFTVDIHVSDPELEVIRNWDESSRILKVNTPKYARLDTPGPHCVSVQITAWFPENAQFTNLLIVSISLTLRVLEDAKVNVSGRSEFGSITGSVIFPTFSNLLQVSGVASSGEDGDLEIAEAAAHPFSSRHILIDTITGSIRGDYPLKDYLGVSSQSGSIKIGVFPEDVDPAAPAPADLEVKTESGSISVILPVRNNPPARNYITHVHSSSGSISGSYYLGSTSTFKSTSGSVRVTALPVLQTDDHDHSTNLFETHTISGTTDVVVLDPIFISLLSLPDEHPVQRPNPDPWTPIDDDDPYLIIPPAMEGSLFTIDQREEAAKKKLRNLRSTHSSNSASVTASYPAAWEGTVHEKSISGSLSVAGDIRIIKEKNGYAFKEILARKGVENNNEGCMVEMGNIAGSLHFRVG